jgi:hypothetical protein
MNENISARSIADSVGLRAAHQILTVIGLPIILGISGWTLLTTVEANERLAVLETLKPRIDRLENMADGRGPVYPLADGRELEKEVAILGGRVGALERQAPRGSGTPMPDRVTSK